MYNSGFVGDVPIRFDVGRLSYGREYQQREFISNDVSEQIRGWLKRHFPQYRDEILSDMQLKLNEVVLDLPH